MLKMTTTKLTDFITGPIPHLAFGLPAPQAEDSPPRSIALTRRRFTVEGEPLMVNAIMREMRALGGLTVLTEIEYQPDQAGWIGKRVEWIDI